MLNQPQQLGDFSRSVLNDTTTSAAYDRKHNRVDTSLPSITQNIRQFANMGSISDSSLDSLNSWLQWISILSIALGLATAVAQMFVGREVDRRAALQLNLSNERFSKLEEQTRTKTTSECIYELFDRLDPNFRTAINNGFCDFNASLRESDYATLKRIAADDNRIRVTPSTNTILDNEGSVIQVHVNIPPDVFT